MSKFLCPCCDYVTLEERGVYDICPVCFWEDEERDLDDLDRVSGPNHVTLREARQNFADCGACVPAMVKNVCSQEERKQYDRRSRTVD
ncbi:MAG: CPCC family cysteine-rich protein [Planctomycetota bacterium]